MWEGLGDKLCVRKILTSMAFSFSAFPHLKGNWSSGACDYLHYLCTTYVIVPVMLTSCFYGRQEARDAKIRKELGQNEKMIYTENEKERDCRREEGGVVYSGQEEGRFRVKRSSVVDTKGVG
jgi:hypothetical protein